MEKELESIHLANAAALPLHPSELPFWLALWTSVNEPYLTDFYCNSAVLPALSPTAHCAATHPLQLQTWPWHMPLHCHCIAQPSAPAAHHRLAARLCSMSDKSAANKPQIPLPSCLKCPTVNRPRNIEKRVASFIQSPPKDFSRLTPRHGDTPSSSPIARGPSPVEWLGDSGQYSSNAWRTRAGDDAA